MSVKLNNNKNVEAVYDSGSQISLIKDNILNKLKHKLKESNIFIKSLAGCSFSNQRATLKLTIGNISKRFEFCLIKENEFRYDILLGLDAIRTFRLNQDADLNIFQINDNDNSKLILNKKNNKILKSDCNLIEINLIESDLNRDELLSELKEIDTDVKEKSKKEMIIKMLIQERNAFATNKFNVKQYEDAEGEIRLLENKIVNIRPYKASLSDQKEIENQIQQLLENDLIEESISPYSASITLANKKNEGKSRLCIDFRQLNKLIVPEAQPFMVIDQILERLRDCSWFTVLDINSAFWTIKLKKESRELTAFSTLRHHYQWKVLPFGLKTSSAIFQRILASVLRKNGLDEYASNYIDDIMVASESFDQHLQHVQNVIRVLNNNNFKLKLSKCKFFKIETEYLGHVISLNSSKPMNDNLQAIKDFPKPDNVKMVRQLLGKINHYNKYIHKRVQRLKPLHDLLKKNHKFNWTHECEYAFNEIKNYLMNKPILTIFDETKKIIIETDGSELGIAAILKQVQDDQEVKPVAYFSCKVNDAQIKRGAIYLECLAIYKSIIYWHYYVHNKQFHVITDHKPLENLRITTPIDTPLGDLVNKLSLYTFTISYRAGAKNIEADCLSRCPINAEFEAEEIFKTCNLIELDEVIDVHDLIDDEFVKKKKMKRIENVIFKKKRERMKIYLNRELADKVIDLVHKKFGHIGIKKTKDLLRKHYYFEKFDDLIDNYIKRCEICIKNKARQKRLIGYLSDFGTIKDPYALISIDTIGGLYGNKTNKRYLHLAIDHYTRYVWGVCSKTQDIDNFINLIRLIQKNGKIKRIIMDQYPALTSNKLKKYLKNESIEYTYTPVDHPATNGTIERAGQTIVNRLRCKLNEEGERRSWSTLIKSVIKEYNDTPHETTGYSPNKLLFNKEIKISPIDNSENADEDKIKMIVINRTKKSQRKNKLRINRLRTDEKLKEGDRVYVKLTNKLNKTKLEQIRQGPFTIKRKLSENVYLVDTGKKKMINNVFHKNHLIKCKDK